MNYFLAQALNNQWANHRLLSACAQLGEREYLADRSGFFPSIQGTLCHILEVDRYYLTALEGDRDGQMQDFSQCLALIQLVQNQTRTDRRLIAFCESLRERDLTRCVELVRVDGVVRERIDRLLLHLFEHQIHHRGQVHGMLSGTSVKPPQIDEFFLDCDRPLRREDEQHLKLDEARIWRDYVLA
jgi:uncharacterized damage-inducible protein DinB